MSKCSLRQGDTAFSEKSCVPPFCRFSKKHLILQRLLTLFANHNRPHRDSFCRSKSWCRGPNLVKIRSVPRLKRHKLNKFTPFRFRREVNEKGRFQRYLNRIRLGREVLLYTQFLKYCRPSLRYHQGDLLGESDMPIVD